MAMKYIATEKKTNVGSIGHAGARYLRQPPLFRQELQWQRLPCSSPNPPLSTNLIAPQLHAPVRWMIGALCEDELRRLLTMDIMMMGLMILMMLSQSTS